MKRRGSGILLHITSLPSAFGIGDFGPEAYRFVRFLAEAKQGYWQVLPLNPTRLERENSPYSSESAFAGNPLLISPELLSMDGLLSKSDLKNPLSFPEGRVDFPRVRAYKEELFRIAFQNFPKIRDCEFDHFCADNAEWLDDYALFSVLKERFPGADWSRWPRRFRDRQRDALRALEKEYAAPVEREKFLQYIFFRQWMSLKNYCRRKGIQIIGDVPIYVDYDSDSVWAHPEIFRLDKNKRPAVVAGIPPDYFSSTGQLWGNPIYRWDVLKKADYAWWVRRFGHNLKLFDWVRLDHFKGFVDFWEVPSSKATAVNGRWVKGPGADLFRTLLKYFSALPFIAEDLGEITAEVHQLRDAFDFPGMRVLQFAFGKDPLAGDYRPDHYIRNCVAYTGTHDNDTLLSWFNGEEDHSTRKPEEIRAEKANALKYLGREGKGRKDIHWDFIRLLMMSVADIVITPMQDILGLGSEARMNRPAVAEGNWEWRSTRGFSAAIGKRLRELTELYGRG